MKQPAAPFSINGSQFRQNDRDVFLLSGEMHYFRIPRSLWDKHLLAAKQAGLTTISSYVPWAWHEPLEGQFDFSGETHPERDLIGWLHACAAHGLQVIVKPGPFILAEFRGAGIPDWFLESSGEQLKMRTREGRLVASDGVNLFHETWMTAVAHWYTQVMPVIRQHQATAGGPIILMQLCNEIGVFSWLAHQADYGPGIKEMFSEWAQQHLGNISTVNRLWGTTAADFSELELPPDARQPYTSAKDRARDYHWHLFWRTAYARYLQQLNTLARSHAVDVPFYHNLPGWIYGHGYEFPVNITMYQQLFADKSELLFGVDHIPEFVSHRNMHDDRIINDFTRAMTGNKPLFAAEFQSGSREYHVVPNPREMALFYKFSIANGLKGWNYYMFSQGKNKPRTGYSGDTFYWFTPLTVSGDKTPAYALVQHTNRMISAIEPLILASERKASICILLYPPYYTTELERPEMGASALTFTASVIRRTAWFDGLLKALQLLNVDYDMADLSQSDAQSLQSYKQIWMFATDEMDARDQQVLVDYATNGGDLLIFPHLPDRTCAQEPCHIVRDALNLHPSGTETIDSPLIDILTFRDVKCANPQVVYSPESLENAEVIARTLRGTPCGFSKALGDGRIRHLGTWLGFDTEAHLPVYQRLLELGNGTLRQAWSTTTEITVRQRFTPDHQALLAVGNYYNEAQAGWCAFTHPGTGETIQIPGARTLPGTIDEVAATPPAAAATPPAVAATPPAASAHPTLVLPPLYAILTPVNMPLWADLTLLYTTSDVLDIRIEPAADGSTTTLHITLAGDRDLIGELVLEGPRIATIDRVHVGFQQPETRTWDNRLLISYTHPHQQTITLTIELS